MADPKKNQTKKQPAKSAIIQAREFKRAGDLEQAKQFALQEVESLKKGNQYNDIIQIAKENV